MKKCLDMFADTAEKKERLPTSAMIQEATKREYITESVARTMSSNIVSGKLSMETIVSEAEEEQLRAELTELQLQSQALQSQLSSLSAIMDTLTSAQAQCAALLIVADAVWGPLPPRGYAGGALLR